MRERQLVSWKIGGEQGQGIDSTGEMLATVCNRLGYYIYGYRQFSSRIKGGHSNYKIRISTEPVASTSADLDVLVAIDQETIDKNYHELTPGSYLVADSRFNPEVPED
ncbi:MAG: 2-oxoacid:acceptor oxidoreductase family protein, partial [Limnochordales bacterium]